MASEQLRDAVADNWDELVKEASAPPMPPQTDVWLTRKEVSGRQKSPKRHWPSGRHKVKASSTRCLGVTPGIDSAM
jgi:hypothetical protein